MPPLHVRPITQPRSLASPVSQLVRLFTTTPSLSSDLGSTPAQQRKSRPQRIPPEAPSFINTPQPPQNQSVEDFRGRGRVKGFLPVPRNVFPGRDGGLKANKAFLERAAAAPSSRRDARDAQIGAATASPTADLHSFKRRMAASRRENLSEGVRSLWERKRRADSHRERRVREVRAAHKAAAEAPEPEDERLTRASVHPAVLDFRVAQDPARFERALASRQRSEAHAREQADRRSDAVQQLYMNARSFIVEEAELEAEVERLFRPDYFSGTTASSRPISNAWDRHGNPPSMRDMFDASKNAKSAGASSIPGAGLAESLDYSRTARRQKRLAEELTGGKMDL